MNLASILEKRGRHADAKVELEAAVAGFSELEAPLRPGTRLHYLAHRETLRSKSNLASLLGDMGEHSAAAALFETVGKARAARLGPGHWQTLFSAVGHATELMALGSKDQAAAILERVAPALAAQLGPDHKKAVWALKQLEVARG